MFWLAGVSGCVLVAVLVGGCFWVVLLLGALGVLLGGVASGALGRFWGGVFLGAGWFWVVLLLGACGVLPRVVCSLVWVCRFGLVWGVCFVVWGWCVRGGARLLFLFRVRRPFFVLIPMAVARRELPDPQAILFGGFWLAPRLPSPTCFSRSSQTLRLDLDSKICCGCSRVKTIKEKFWFYRFVRTQPVVFFGAQSWYHHDAVEQFSILAKFLEVVSIRYDAGHSETPQVADARPNWPFSDRICLLACLKYSFPTPPQPQSPSPHGRLKTIITFLDFMGIKYGKVLPTWSYMTMGPRSHKFDAVCGFSEEHRLYEVEWRHEWSNIPNITWLEINANMQVVGFYVPPLNTGHTEEERKSLLEELFLQIDEIKRQMGKESAIIAYGDLNPTKDLMRVYKEQLLRRRFVEHIPEDVHTHIAHRRLDVVFSDEYVSVEAVVHNGSHFRGFGCERKQCGDTERHSTAMT